MEKVWKVARIVFLVALVLFSMFSACTPQGVAMCNTYVHTLKDVDELTNYNTKKTVEDTCRSMIASYTSDKLTYEQYCDSDNEEEQSWAEQAKMRANKTAATYNNYILKNSYVWDGNVPSDISSQLTYID